MRDPSELLLIAQAAFERRLRLVTVDDWERPTPCAEWDVRALVNHVIGANRRYAMLLHGASAASVDATRSLDHIGADAIGSFVATATELGVAFDEYGALNRTVHHPIGDRRGKDLLAMRVLDVAVHGWDLARAIDADETIDPDLVEFLLTLATGSERSRQNGSFSAPVGDAPRTASRQAQLLHLLGRTTPMTDADTFLEATLPRMLEADTALHNGDARLRSAIWSHHEPVTLFGAAVSKTGWADIGPTFEWLATRFSNYESADWEVLAADASGNLAYMVCIEHTTVSINGAETAPYSLRVTTVFRREEGEWKVVHRHGDPYDATSERLVARIAT